MSFEVLMIHLHSWYLNLCPLDTHSHNHAFLHSPPLLSPDTFYHPYNNIFATYIILHAGITRSGDVFACLHHFVILKHFCLLCDSIPSCVPCNVGSTSNHHVHCQNANRSLLTKERLHARGDEADIW